MAGRVLKVYRMPIGFHDAYVAAPSRKAALEAWGSDHDLFARGVAEVVTDAALIAEPLAQPGVVVKRLRGTAAEQIAALPPEPAKSGARRAKGEPPGRSLPPKPRPLPDRTALDDAEAALSRAKTRQQAENEALAREEAELARRRRAMDTEHKEEIARLERARDKARSAYDRAQE